MCCNWKTRQSLFFVAFERSNSKLQCCPNITWLQTSHDASNRAHILGIHRNTSHTSVTRSLCTNSYYNVPCISFLLKCICMQCHMIANGNHVIAMGTTLHCMYSEEVTHVHKIANCGVRQRSNLLWQMEAVIGLIPKQNSCNKGAESASMFVQPSPAQEYTILMKRHTLN